MIDAILLTAACTITALLIAGVACIVCARPRTPDDHSIPHPDEGR